MALLSLPEARGFPAQARGLLVYEHVVKVAKNEEETKLIEQCGSAGMTNYGLST